MEIRRCQRVDGGRFFIIGYGPVTNPVITLHTVVQGRLTFNLSSPSFRHRITVASSSYPCLGAVSMIFDLTEAILSEKTVTLDRPLNHFLADQPLGDTQLEGESDLAYGRGVLPLFSRQSASGCPRLGLQVSIMRARPSKSRSSSDSPPRCTRRGSFFDYGPRDRRALYPWIKYKRRRKALMLAFECSSILSSYSTRRSFIQYLHKD